MRRSTGLALVAGSLTAAWLANHLAARAAERRHPPTGRFITIDGIRLHYLEAGSGPPIVLLHGNGTLAEDFVVSGLFDRLARTHRVVAFDRPGFGYSARPRRRRWTARAQAVLLAKAIDRLGLDRPIVVGHSWGALVALAIALDHDVGGLALLAGPILPEARSDTALAVIPATPVVGELLVHTIWPLLARLIWPRLTRLLFQPAMVANAFASRFPAALALRPGQLRAGAADLAMLLSDQKSLSARAANLPPMPILILTGTGDAIVDPQRHAIPLQQMIGGELCLIAGAGHMVHHTEPGLVADAIEVLGNGSVARMVVPLRPQ